MHELNHRTGLEALVGVAVTFAAILICGKSASRKLAVGAHDRLVVAFRGIKQCLVPGLLEIDGRLAESLRQIDAVPIMHAVRPIQTGFVDLGRQFQEPPVAGAIVEPVDTFEIVAGADLRPVTGQEISIGHAELPLEVTCQER